MYHFNRYYVKYRNDCTSFSAVRVDCASLQWTNRTTAEMLSQVSTIATAQCDKCVDAEICDEWTSYISTLNDTVYGTVCDEDQCDTGYNNCDANALCVNECNGYTCNCVEGFVGDGYSCIKKCDEDQCVENPCSDNADCTDKCEGFQCTCHDGYHMETTGYSQSFEKKL